MQPMYTVDHGTRRNSLRREDDLQTPREVTPLLVRYPRSPSGQSAWSMVTVTILLCILILGVVIGIYLLILQSNSENILPPVRSPLRLVSRAQWGRGVAASSPPRRGRPARVVAVQTDTEQCATTASCAALLQHLLGNTTSDLSLPYNFLVSSNGETYESLGWRAPSPLFPEYAGSMVLAFIGNFTEIPPTQLQMDEARNLFAESVSQQHLLASFDIIGKRSGYTPTSLFRALATLPQWNQALSDV